MNDETKNPISGHDHHEPMPEGEEHAPPGVRVMAVVRWSMVLLLALLAIASWFAFGRTRPPPSQPAATAPADDHQHDDGGDGEQAAATRYVCPMHPQVIQDHPGECPICHMDLVPLKVGGSRGSSDHGVDGVVPVELTQNRIQLMGMRTEQARLQKVTTSVRTVGYVVADERRISRLHARTSGWVEELRASTTGQQVKKGEILARVYSPELLAAQRELVALASGAQGGSIAGALVGDVKRKLSLFGMSNGDIEQVARSGKASRTVNLRAPTAGYVTNKGAFDGLYFQPGTALFEVSDLSTVWVIAEVYESELSQVQVGQRAVVELTAYPGKTFRGTVGFVYPVVDPSTRTMRVRVEVPNPDMKLLPGMYAQVTVWTEGEEGVVVPVEAMIDTGEQQYVFIASGDGLFEPRLVKFGRRTEGGVVEVVEGLEEGEIVVTTANFLLDSESRLRAALERSTSPVHHAPASDAPSHDAH